MAVDDFTKWQNKIFQEIDELEHVEAQMDARSEDVIMRVADAYGLKKQDVGKLITPGMNGGQLRAAMRAARKK